MGTVVKTLLEDLKDGVRSVLGNAESTSKEKIEAINAGTKLLEIEHKITGNSDKPGNFFGGK